MRSVSGANHEKNRVEALPQNWDLVLRWGVSEVKNSIAEIFKKGWKTMTLRPLPDDFCPLTSELPEGWSAPVTILPEGYFEHFARGGKPIQMEIFEE